MRLRALLLTFAVAIGGPSLVTSPAAAKDITVTVRAAGCSDCRLTVITDDWDKWGWSDRQVQIRGGKATLRMPSKVGGYALGVYDHNGYTGLSAVDTVAFQYRGFAPGDPVSARRSAAGRKARICHQAVDGETVRVRIVKVPITAKMRRKSVIPIPRAQKYTMRAWASPTLSTTDRWTSTWHGETGVSNTVCGSGWPGNR